MNKPTLIERLSDCGELAYWELVDDAGSVGGGVVLLTMAVSTTVLYYKQLK